MSRKTAPHTLFNADIPTVAVAEPRRNAYVSAVVSMFFFFVSAVICGRTLPAANPWNQ